MSKGKAQKHKGYKITEKFSIAPYNNYDIQFLIMEQSDTKTLKRLNKEMESCEFDGSEHAFTHDYYDGRKNILVGFNLANIHGSKMTCDCIAHEAVHVKNIIYDNIGQRSNTKTRQDENEAYLIGYLSHIIFDFFSKTGNLNKIDFTYNEKHYSDVFKTKK